MKASLVLVAYLPLLCVAAVALPALPANIEVDVIFPRNDTYSPADNFPIVLAVQNAALAYDFGFQVLWEVRNLSKSGPSTNLVDFESILHSNALEPKVPAPSSTFFILNSTTEFEDFLGEAYGIYQLNWFFALDENCTRDGIFIDHEIGNALAGGGLIFTIADDGKAVDFTDGGPCPPTGGAVGIQSNISGCAHIDNTGVVAKPCNIVLNEQLASSFSANLPPITTASSVSTTSMSSTSMSSISSTTRATTTISGSNSGTSTSMTTTTTTATSSNDAPNKAIQTVVAILAGAAGLYGILV
ncbi:hypothetical protein TWF694_008304 [Orbilia ellipsospora]|uniref:DUF7136 domain-containing protein n=1 Tax=Orbilia ellipsospora TaxID=2528407 RepID=A0AAV9XFP1_9PEZI